MLLDEMTGYAWDEAFACAGLNREDIATLLGYDAGMNDDENWIVCGQLKSGDYFFMTAGCDYTGWDCRSWGSTYYYKSLEELLSLGLSERDAHRMGLCQQRDEALVHVKLAINQLQSQANSLFDAPGTPYNDDGR